VVLKEKIHELKSYFGDNYEVLRAKEKLYQRRYI
jgi:hypothetical protein